MHAEQPSTRVDWSAGTVRVLIESVAWPQGPEPRGAAASSFGVSGTNAHLIIEQAPQPDPTPPVSTPVDGSLPWPISAHSDRALRAPRRCGCVRMWRTAPSSTPTMSRAP
ncbi:ketoacyl-synthetase C-terminal extension domain-containing protein [Streptomyces sp. WM6378]|uniref:ketoacyl-synthetase C-terminal extension domain-containing protein n=1 Tax=Streptomyces sp. WM6378 TaxID=1415557 RepID=UPI00099D6002